MYQNIALERKTYSYSQVLKIMLSRHRNIVEKDVLLAIERVSNRGDYNKNNKLTYSKIIVTRIYQALWNKDNFTVKDIAELLGGKHNEQSVRQRIKKLKLTPVDRVSSVSYYSKRDVNKLKKASEETNKRRASIEKAFKQNKDLAVQLKNDGNTYQAIGERLGLSVSSVNSLFSKINRHKQTTKIRKNNMNPFMLMSGVKNV